MTGEDIVERIEIEGPFSAFAEGYLDPDNLDDEWDDLYDLLDRCRTHVREFESVYGSLLSELEHMGVDTGGLT